MKPVLHRPQLLDHDGGTSVDPMYSSGLFLERSAGCKDAPFKVEQLRRMLSRHTDLLRSPHPRIADVGCGSGAVTTLIPDMMRSLLRSETTVDGYDVHPKVKELAASAQVRFISGDFCSTADGIYDLAILFDVIEHVSNPVGFLHQVAQFARLVALHIPLDDSLFSWIRRLPQEKLEFPGHLLVLDAAAAINLITFADLRVIDFDWSPAFRAPSGVATRKLRLMKPMRELLWLLSPHLLQRLLGGVSLMVLARSRLAECANQPALSASQSATSSLPDCPSGT